MNFRTDYELDQLVVPIEIDPVTKKAILGLPRRVAQIAIVARLVASQPHLSCCYSLRAETAQEETLNREYATEHVFPSLDAATSFCNEWNQKPNLPKEG